MHTKRLTHDKYILVAQLCFEIAHSLECFFKNISIHPWLWQTP
jgi:hypothetical protein